MAAGKIKMRRKMTLALIVMLLAFVAVVVQLVNIQLVQGSELQLKAEENRTRDQAVAASRGTIYDVNGKKLAISITADSISASPPDVKEADAKDVHSIEDTATFLARALDLDVETVRQRITSETAFTWIKRKVDFEIAEAIKQAELPGINIVPETRRYYPRGTLAAHILGYSGIDNQGLEGLEHTLDDVLSGTAGRIIGEYDANGRLLPQGRMDFIQPSDGHDVYLTIDENIQYFCERELDELMVSEVAPKSAGIIMMDPKTGAILAWAIRPSYDPNNFSAAAEGAQRNILNADIYEPGSTFKIFTAAAALEEGTATLQSRYYDSGSITVAGQRIRCWRHYNPHGDQSFTEALMHSCNPALITMGQQIESKEKGLFYKYIRAFGFGEPTGIELSGEAKGMMYSSPGPVELATTCIGQGISVTPIQMVAAVSAVANGGTLLQPQIVYQIKDKDSEEIVKDFEPVVVRQVISAETSETLRGVLEEVATNGTGRNAYIEGYRVGGKTGTAEKPESGSYAEGKFVASFVGMAPVNDPQVVCLVFIDEPVRGHHQGSTAAAPVFKDVVEDTMRYLGVVPQITATAGPDETQTAMARVPDLAGLSGAAAAEVLGLAGLKPELRGSGRVLEQVPAAFAEVELGTQVIVTLSEEAAGLVTVPDLTGKRLSAAAEWLAAYGLTINAEGNAGTAHEQEPLPGSRVEAGSSVKVKFDLIEASTTELEP